MLPNMDPRAMKAMMAKMGIRSTDVEARKVTIECDGMDIIVENPQVTKIEMQGVTSFQVAGTVSEQERKDAVEINDDDIRMVQESTGITDAEEVRAALEAANGDIARAILALKGQRE